MLTVPVGESVIDRRRDLPLSGGSRIEAQVLAGSHNSFGDLKYFRGRNPTRMQASKEAFIHEVASHLYMR